MQTKKSSEQILKLAKSAVAALALPAFLLYVMIGKPDYKIMNAMAHVVLPAANAVGDIVTWPVRAVNNAAASIRELSTIKTENAELRAKLAAAENKQAECDIAIVENQRLAKLLDTMKSIPHKSVVAGVVMDNSAFHHGTFFIDKGRDAGIEPGMAVVSTWGALVGQIIDVGTSYARARSLFDSKSNIPVRIAGSEVYGFLAGHGASDPSMGFFSDPEFQPTPGLKLVTSGIRGILPDGIPVGDMKNESDANVSSPARVTDVIVLQFNNGDKYK